MAFHAGHGVADIVGFGNPCSDIHQGIFRHHGFIHSVKCQQPAVRRPVGAFADAEFIAVHRLPVYYTLIRISSYGNLTCPGGYVKVVSDGIGNVAGFRGGIGIFGKGIHCINYL